MCIYLYLYGIFNKKFTSQKNILEFTIKNCVLVAFFMSIIFEHFNFLFMKLRQL